MRARVRQDRVGCRADKAIHINDIQVQRAGRVGLSAHAAVGVLDGLESGQKLGRCQGAGGTERAVDVAWLVAGGHWGAGEPSGADAGGEAGQGAQRAGRPVTRLQRTGAIRGWEVSPYGNYHENVRFFLARGQQPDISRLFPGDFRPWLCPGHIERPLIMHFLPQERVCLFIDGANLYSASRNLGFDVDYRNLLEYFRRQCHVLRAYYYSAVLETEEYSPLKPLTDWLAYNGYTLVTKPAREFTDAMGRRRLKGNMDIELAIDMLELSEKMDHAVLFSGDSDFRRLIEAVQRRGVRVSVVSSIRTTPPMVADELRRQADQFLELADIAPEFTRRQMEPRPRLARADALVEPDDHHM